MYIVSQAINLIVTDLFRVEFVLTALPEHNEQGIALSFSFEFHISTMWKTYKGTGI